MKFPHDESICNIACDKCSKTFTRKDNLWKHRERIHGLFCVNIDAINKKETIMCEICKKKFKTPDLLVSHITMRTCSSELSDEGKFMGNICKKKLCIQICSEKA